MSVTIINPFNQLIQFTKGFYHQNEFYNEFLKSFENFAQNYIIGKDDNLMSTDFSIEQLEDAILKRFDIPLTNVANDNINYFFKDVYSIASNSKMKKELCSESIFMDNFINFIKKEFKITPYVSEKFIPFLLNLDQFELRLVFRNVRDKCIFNFLFCLLDLEKIEILRSKINDYRMGFKEYEDYECFISDISKQLLENVDYSPLILIYEDPQIFMDLCSSFETISSASNKDKIKDPFSGLVFHVFNSLLFSSKQKLYTDFKSHNLQNLVKNGIRPDFVIESLMQANLFIEFTFKKTHDIIQNKSSLQLSYIDHSKSIRQQFFNEKQKRVLYFFNEDNSTKSYRKRLLAITTENIIFIPFITRGEIDFEFYNRLYGKIDVLLQRAPYFYLESEEKKDLCIQLEKYLSIKNEKVLKMSSFDIVEKLFFRFNCYSFIKNFIEKSAKEIKDKFNFIVDVPYTISYNFEKLSLDFMKDYLEKSDNLEFVERSKESLLNFLQTLNNQINIKMKTEQMDFPVVIKPDECEVHEMFLILSEAGLNQFLNVGNFKKILKSKNFVIQKFINHDGLMFKNFFINKKSYTFIRPSLPNLEGKNLKIDHFKDDCFKFKNEFLYNKDDDSFWTSIENPNEKLASEEVNYDLIDYISKLFATYMDVNLFGLDYLFDRNTKTYYILECNYFPSYRELKEKLQPEFESHIITYHNEELIK